MRVKHAKIVSQIGVILPPMCAMWQILLVLIFTQVLFLRDETTHEKCQAGAFALFSELISGKPHEKRQAQMQQSLNRKTSTIIFFLDTEGAILVIHKIKVSVGIRFY